MGVCTAQWKSQAATLTDGRSNGGGTNLWYAARPIDDESKHRTYESMAANPISVRMNQGQPAKLQSKLKISIQPLTKSSGPKILPKGQ
jgi:hypothetical protein